MTSQHEGCLHKRLESIPNTDILAQCLDCGKSIPIPNKCNHKMQNIFQNRWGIETKCSKCGFFKFVRKEISI